MAETKRKKDDKTCGVCGDHALGSNFNAITCESCKAFFRRNALKTKDFKCPFENSCKVDMVTRRFCQKCRLKKCFAIGMKKEFIMSEEQKKEKRVKIEKNRQKRSLQQSNEIQDQEFTYVKVESPDDSMLSSPISSMSPMTPQTPGSVGMTADIPKARMFAHQPLTPSDCEYSPPAKVRHLNSPNQDDLISNESSQPPNSFSQDLCEIKMLVESEDENSDGEKIQGTSSQSETESSVLSLLRTEEPKQSQFTTIPQSVYAKAIDIEFTELPIRNTNSNAKELTALEKLKIQELVVANEVLKLPLVCGVTDPCLLDVINMTDHAIRRLIKMSKKINSFKNLCQTDQISLLKGGCTELMILRSVMSYDPEKDCWQGPKGPKIMSIKVDILKEAKGNVYEEHKRFINSFHPQWRADENIMLILSGIALFTPERPNTVHKEAIKLEQDTYYYLLRRYLDSVYSWCEARATYLKLIHKIEELHLLNENHVRVYLDVNPKDVEPLLIEIFDLKH